MIVSSTPKAHISVVTLVGGGTNPQPGEVSLAHNGVLFLDELAEFKRTALEVLRQPLEDGHITVARNKLSVDYPAHFMLVAAMTPCPFGHYGDLDAAMHPEVPVTNTLSASQLLQAIQFRQLDRSDWGE